MKTALSILIPALLVGILVAAFWPGKTKVVAIPEPLTYTLPIPVLSPASAKPGEAVTILSNRCQTTGADLFVDVSIFLQSEDRRSLLPYILKTPTASGQVGPVFSGVIPPGCVKTESKFTIPAETPPGHYRIKGSICWGGIALPESRRKCTSWESDVLEVLGEAPPPDSRAK